MQSGICIGLAQAASIRGSSSEIRRSSLLKHDDERASFPRRETGFVVR
jgi:hypothetical protein